MSKPIKYLIVFGEIVVILSLVRGIFDSFKVNGRIDDLVRQKKKLVYEQRLLRERLDEVTKRDYVERVVRDKLHMVRPDEVLVIVEGDEGVVVGGVNDDESLSNWRKWMKVVFDW